MKPTKQLPDNYNLETVFELDHKTTAKKNLLVVAYILAFVTGIPFLIHVFTVMVDVNFISAFAFIIWVASLFISLVVVMIGIILIKTLLFVSLTRRKPQISFDKYYIYCSDGKWYFPRSQALQIYVFPDVIMIIILLIAIPLVPIYFVSGLLLAISFTFTFGSVNFILGLYLSRSPANTIVRQDRSRIEIYHYHKHLEKLDGKDTDQKKPNLTQHDPDDIYFDLAQLKKKEKSKIS